MFSRRVVVTGIGLVTPLGLGQHHNWSKLLKGESGISILSSFDASDLTCRIGGEIPSGHSNEGKLNLDVSDEIIAKRLEEYQPVLPEIKSGYQKMYIDHVMQADKGADLDFLVGKRGSEVKRHSH